MKKHIIKTTWKRMKYNARALIEFEIVYKLLLTLIGLPILFGLLQWSMDIHGYRYLDTSSILSFMMEPTTIVIFIVVVAMMTLFTMMELHAIIICYQASANHERISMIEMLYIGIKKAFHMFKRKNAMLMVFVLCVIPLTNTAAVSGLITSIRIPEFIHTYIMEHTFLLVLFALFMMLCVLLSLRWAFSLHAYTCMDYSFKEARVYSAYIMKKNYVRTMAYLVLWQLVQAIVAFFVIVFLGGISILCIKIWISDAIGYGMAIRAISTIMQLVYVISLYCSVPLSFALLSSLYDTYQQEKRSTYQYTSQKITITRRSRRFFITLLMCVLFIALYQTWTLQRREVNVVHELKEVPEITAHRGDSVHAPENSMPAFKKAIEAHADWIELDVHQTKDGVVVVTHDADLKRIARVDKKIYELTYEQLQQYDVGSWFSSKYQGLQVATLEEVVALCKGKIKLNIELKPTGHEQNYEQHVLDILYAYDIQDECVVSSLHKKALKTIKKLDKNISTLYIMSVAIGDVGHFPFADSIGVEASFISDDVLDSVHRKGKKLTAWTVNQEENVKAMIDLGVDNIITDNPSGVYTIIYENRTNAWIDHIVKLFF